MDLKIQDSLGLDSGTTYDWTRSHDGGVHAVSWNIGPSLGDQSTYEANWAFTLPQDSITLDTTAIEPQNAGAPPFRCYSNIPRKTRPPFKEAFAAQDLDALAAGDYPQYEQFKRIRVDGVMPLALWLEHVTATLDSTPF